MFSRFRTSSGRKRRSRSKARSDRSNHSNDSSILIEDESPPKTIENLVAVVTTNKERLVSGEARLSLTPSSLLTVNTAFNKYQAEVRLQQDGVSLSSHDSGINGLLSRNRTGLSSLTSPSCDEIEFRVDTYVLHVSKEDVRILHQLLAKTKSLKITHGAETILGRIRLAPLFKELAVLELKRIPIHLVCGISQLRSSLNSLSAIRSLSSLEEIFVKCGGDVTEPQSWAGLKSVNLSGNGIVRLDSSLRLLPKLETLDLSHNLLTSTEHFLEYLPELRRLNISYNHLESFPSLSYSARRRLTVLSLRGNNLEHLQGLDVLTDLTQLDCRDNCISEMRALEPMAQLHMLHAVAFLGNPIAFLKEYRTVALQFVSRRAALERKIYFDGRELTKRETAFLPQHPPRLYADKRNADDSMENEITLSLPIDGTRSGRTPLGSRARKERNRSRRLRLAREAPITDTETPYDTDADLTDTDVGFSSIISVDDGGDDGGRKGEDSKEKLKRMSSTKGRGTDLDESAIDEMKAKVEELRLSRGQDWLHEWRGIVQSKELAVDQSRPEDEQPRGDGVSNENDCVGDVEPSSTEVASIEVARTSGDAQTRLIDDAEVSATPSSAVDWAEAVFKDDKPATSDLMRPEEDDEAGKLAREEEEEGKVVVPAKDYGVELNSYIVLNDCISDCPFCESNDGEDIQRVEDDGLNEGDRVDPLRFLSVTQKYIVEKDLDGDVLQEMEFSCLETKEVTWNREPAEDEMPTQSTDDKDREDETSAAPQVRESDDATPPTTPDSNGRDNIEDSKPPPAERVHFHPSVSLRFSYIRKDRRLRQYWFEDADTLASFINILDSLADDEEEAATTTIFHCLRCSHEYQWQRKNTEKIYSSGSRRSRSQEVAKVLSASPPVACPECQSPLVVELESNPDGVEAKAADLPATEKESEGGGGGGRRQVGGIGEGDGGDGGGGGRGEEVARISWLEKSTSEAREVPSSSDATLLGSALANASSDSSIAIITPRQDDSASPSSFPTNDQLPLPSDAIEASTAIRTPSLPAPQSKPTFFLDSVHRGGNEPSPEPSSSGSIAIADEEEEEERGVDSGTPRPLANSATAPSAVRGGVPGGTAATIVEDNGSVDSSRMQTPSGSLIDGFTTAASLTKSVFQNMAASVIASSLGTSPSPSAGTVESHYADATAASPIKSPCKQELRQQQKQQTEQQQQQQKQQLQKQQNQQLERAAPPKEESNASNGGGSFSFPPFYFDSVDHRLSLYFDLVLFGDEEEFVSVLCADVVVVGKPVKKDDGSPDIYAPTPSLVVTSTLRIYVLKIVDKMQGQPDSWLELVEDLPLTSLAYLDWGLGLLSFRLEFADAESAVKQNMADHPGSSTYCVIIRDDKRCMKYVRGLIDQVKRSTSSPLSQLKSISKQQNPESLRNLMTAVGKKNDESADDKDSPPDNQEGSFQYFLAFEIGDESSSSPGSSSVSSAASSCPTSPVTLVITDGDLHLLSENFHHPPPRDSPSPPKSILDVPQFVVKQKTNITEIASVDMLGEIVTDYPNALIGCALSFFDQSEPRSLAFESAEALDAFVAAVAKLWEEDFGVELEINR